MARVEELRRLWEERLPEPFPDAVAKGEDYVGVDLVMLDADIAGVVSSFLGSHRLDERQRGIVRGCRATTTLPFLPFLGKRRCTSDVFVGCSTLCRADGGRADAAAAACRRYWCRPIAWSRYSAISRSPCSVACWQMRAARGEACPISSRSPASPMASTTGRGGARLPGRGSHPTRPGRRQGHQVRLRERLRRQLGARPHGRGGPRCRGGHGVSGLHRRQAGVPAGGRWRRVGLEEFLAAVGDPDHEEHDELLDWAGGQFDPQYLDLAPVNRALAPAGRRCASCGPPRS